jgi:hypothetical protein
MLNELRDLDFNDIGSAPLSVRYVILSLLLAIILAIGYYLLIKNKTEQLERVQQKELTLRSDFEYKQQKAANLKPTRHSWRKCRNSKRPGSCRQDEWTTGGYLPNRAGIVCNCSAKRRGQSTFTRNGPSRCGLAIITSSGHLSAACLLPRV